MDTERLSSIDEYGWKKQIIPADVKGRFRKWRSRLQSLLILFFLALPWFRLNGHQALFVDIAHREFSFLGLKLYSHDAPMLFLVVGIFVFGIVFTSNVWGRLWCGWACPQTVFIEGIYRRLEELIEGNYRERRLALTQPMTFSKATRKILKWLSFFVVSSIIAHSFVAIFIGSTELLSMMRTPPRENWTYFILITVVTGILLFDFGWFREQFCVIMCPYGRFQSVLMDSTSMAILYDEKRGEPRRGSVPRGEKVGDCISCQRCVEVCPTGIDIRRGVQMECISCTACIDACDDIMDRVHKPRGLIKYANLRGGTWMLLKGRALFSGGMTLLCLFLLTGALWNRTDLDVSILRGKQPLYLDITTGDGPKRFANQFHLHIRNQTSRELTVELTTDPGVSIATQSNPFNLKAGEDRQVPFFAQFPQTILNHNGEAFSHLKIKLNDSAEPFIRSLNLEGPVKK